MSCCSATDRFFSFFAKFYAWKLEKKGFEKSQKKLFEALNVTGFKDQSILEIGCGTGYFHQSLLQAGAARARGVDMSQKMIAYARRLAAKKGLDEITEYETGDFVEDQDHYKNHDLILLDKVICCYPDPDKLIGISTEKCDKTYAVTYPRDSLIPKLTFGIAGILLTVLRSEFKPRVHSVASITSQIEQAGFIRSSHWQDFFWISEVYERTS